MIVQCPHCRTTVLPSPDHVCPACRQIIPAPAEAPLASLVVAEAVSVPVVEPVTPLPVDDQDINVLTAQVADNPAEILIISDSEHDHSQASLYYPEPGFVQAIGMIVGWFMLSGVVTGMFCAVYRLATRSDNPDDYIPLGMVANSLVAALLAWSALQPQSMQYLAFTAPKWKHLAIAMLLPLPMQLVLVGVEEAFVRFGRTEVAQGGNSRVSATATTSPLAAVGKPRDSQSWQERIFHAYEVLAGCSWPVVLLVGCVLPGICEEMFFRGYLGRGLVANLGRFGGVFLTSVFFGLVHLEPVQMVYTAILGIVLHITFLCSKSIWMPMVLHFVNNVLAFGTMKLSLEGQIPVQADGTIGIPWPVALASLFVVIALLRLLYQTRTAWYDADGNLLACKYTTAESPGLPHTTLRQAPATLASYGFCGAALLTLLGASLATGYGNRDHYLARQKLLEGNSAQAEAKFAAAYSAYNQAVELDPQSAEALCGRAMAGLSLGNTDQAKADAQRAIELAPKYAMAWAVLAEARNMLGDSEAALADATQACELDPRNYWTYIVKAQCAQATQHYDRALEASFRARELAPNDPFTRTWRCRFLTNCPDASYRDLNTAIQELTEPGFTMPQTPECHFALAQAYFAQGNLSLAIDRLQSCKPLASGVERQRYEYYLHHYPRVAESIAQLRKAWNTPWIDDLVIYPPCRHITIVVPESHLAKLADKPLELPNHIGWKHQLITQAKLDKQAAELIQEFQTKLMVDYTLAESLAWHGAPSRAELAHADIAELAKAIAVDSSTAKLIIDTAKQSLQPVLPN